MDELVTKAKLGDSDAYTELISSMEKELYGVAQAKLSDIDDINDAIQETIIKSYRNINKLNNPAYFKTWIIKILINECNLIYRNKYKQLGIFDKLSENYTYELQSHKDILDVESNIDFEILISKLDYNDRLIITLFYNNRLSEAEIANVLNIKINALRVKLCRAKEKLKRMYKKEGGLKNESTK